LSARDGIHYNPYTFSSDSKTLCASYILGTGESYCIPKAILLGAAARYKGIPSRLGLADVKNHLSSPKLIAWLRSDIFRMHGYIELYLNQQWVKATPAFNIKLCRLMGVDPLEFDGVHDSIFQEYTGDGQQHMEYINEYGTFADVPFAFIDKNIRHAYPHLFTNNIADFTGRTLEDDL
jgi:transglutaminase-like putative cysteine protease